MRLKLGAFFMLFLTVPCWAVESFQEITDLPIDSQISISNGMIQVDANRIGSARLGAVRDASCYFSVKEAKPYERQIRKVDLKVVSVRKIVTDDEYRHENTYWIKVNHPEIEGLVCSSRIATLLGSDGYYNESGSIDISDLETIFSRTTDATITLRLPDPRVISGRNDKGVPQMALSLSEGTSGFNSVASAAR